MRTKEAIFFNKLVHYNPKDFPNGMKNAIYKAMQEYAEEYHRAELLKLNKSDVISSVCNHTWEPYYDKGYRKCTNCGMELGMPLQTDL